MRISFHRVEIHNFMSFADEVFDFDTQKGLNLITGKNFDIPSSKNGSGKSNLFWALLFGLYGQLPDKMKSEHIANRSVEDKDVRVVVYLDVDGNNFKAVTGLNKRAQGYFQLMTCSKDWKTETDSTKSSIAETRKFFENQIIHCDISLFLRTVLLTSEQDYNFFKLKKQDKKDFIEKLFDISVFGDMYAKIHRDVLDVDKEALSLQNQLIVLNRNQDDYAKRIEDFDKQQNQQKEQLQTQTAKFQAEFDVMSKNTVKKNTELIGKYEDAKTKLDEAKQKVNEQILTKRANINKIASEIKLLISAKDDKSVALSKHAELIGKLCNDCKKVFLEYHSLTTYQKEIDESEKDIAAKKEVLKKEKSEFEDLQKKAALIQTKIDSAVNKLNELNKEYDETKSKQNAIQKKLEMLKMSLSQVEQKVNPYVALLDSTLNDIKEEQSKLDKVQKRAKCLKKAEEIVSQDSLKKFIIKDLIGLINNRIKTYLMKMGANYTCQFDENLDYDFMTDTGNCELANFSCGEKKRLEIATCLSFRDFISQRSNITSNILVLDEYIDSGIDTLAVDNILSVLKDFASEHEQNIFIISHRTEVTNEMFDRVIEVQKKNGISTITYQQSV